MTMNTLSELFEIRNARSKAFEDHKAGKIAFVTNGFENNGVIGFVDPISGDRVFSERGICLSAFCEATVQEPPFLPRGNGGSGLIVLQPRQAMSYRELLYYSAYLNATARWRFSFGRMITKERAKRIPIPKVDSVPQSAEPSAIMPPRETVQTDAHIERFKWVAISELFDLHSGDYHKASALGLGKIPLVSCGEADNGIIGYYKIPPENQYRHTLTIAYNGAPLLTKYHPYVFGAKDDVAVCIPKKKLRLSTLLYVQLVLNRETWRHSYGRKCFREKLKRFQIQVPVNEKDELDESVIENTVSFASYWGYFRNMAERLKIAEPPANMEKFLAA
jgi:hypothetical protein